MTTSTTAPLTRRARVEVAGRVLEVAGPRAELVALLAVTDLPARTLRLLLAVALEQERLARIEHGSLTVDLAPGQLRLHWRETRPQVVIRARDVV